VSKKDTVYLMPTITLIHPINLIGAWKLQGLMAFADTFYTYLFTESTTALKASG